MEKCSTIAMPLIEETMKQLFVSPQSTTSNCVLIWNNESRSVEVYPVSIIRACISTVELRLSQLSYTPACNVIGLCDWIISCPECILFDTKQRDDFFVAAFEYTVSRYDPKNVVCGVIRFDAQIPCIHILFVPVVDTNHLSASKRVTSFEKKEYKNGLHELVMKKFDIPYLRFVSKNNAVDASDVLQNTFTDFFADEKELLDSRERELAAWSENLKLREKLLDARFAALREREEYLSQCQLRVNNVLKKSLDMLSATVPKSAPNNQQSSNRDCNTQGKA